jgi:bifunctional non-homologous end joining protein LigD
MPGSTGAHAQRRPRQLRSAGSSGRRIRNGRGPVRCDRYGNHGGFTRRGHDWSGRYPSIAVTATLLRARSFTIDGEAVVCGPDGVAVFDALHRRGTVSEAMLYGFDLLELDGEDLRAHPLGDRKKRLARLLGGRRLGIVLSDHTDEDGATIFRQACRMGLEGIVSKKLTAPYRSGPSRDWIKVKNPDSPAMIRAREW